MKIPNAFEGRTSLDQECRPILPVRIVYGIGDRMLALPAMREYGLRAGYPCFDVLTDKHGDIYDGLPFIANVHVIPGVHRPANHVAGSHADVINLHEYTNGWQGSFISACFKALDVADAPAETRRIPYALSGREGQWADDVFARSGGDTLILGTQTRGGHGRKSYARLREAVDNVIARGWIAWEITEDGYVLIHNTQERIPCESPRTVAALLARSSCWLGFDSGPSKLALAVDCPSVFLSGPVTMTDIIATLGGHRYWTEIHHGWRGLCEWIHGHSCWPENERCPVRGWTGGTTGPLGADCVDHIDPDEIWAAIVNMVESKTNA